jgi:hypothetical protein
MAEKDVVVLVLDEPAADIRPIYKATETCKLALEVHLLSKTPLSSGER